MEKEAAQVQGERDRAVNSETELRLKFLRFGQLHDQSVVSELGGKVEVMEKASEGQVSLTASPIGSPVMGSPRCTGGGFGEVPVASQDPQLCIRDMTAATTQALTLATGKAGGGSSPVKGATLRDIPQMPSLDHSKVAVRDRLVSFNR